MAKSLIVKHEEKPGTSVLLNTFLAVALLWMALGAVFAAAAEAPVGEGVQQTSP